MGGNSSWFTFCSIAIHGLKPGQMKRRRFKMQNSLSRILLANRRLFRFQSKQHATKSSQISTGSGGDSPFAFKSIQVSPGDFRRAVFFKFAYSPTDKRRFILSYLRKQPRLTTKPNLPWFILIPPQRSDPPETKLQTGQDCKNWYTESSLLGYIAFITSEALGNGLTTEIDVVLTCQKGVLCRGYYIDEIFRACLEAETCVSNKIESEYNYAFAAYRK